MPVSPLSHCMQTSLPLNPYHKLLPTPFPSSVSHHPPSSLISQQCHSSLQKSTLSIFQSTPLFFPNGASAIKNPARSSKTLPPHLDVNTTTRNNEKAPCTKDLSRKHVSACMKWLGICLLLIFWSGRGKLVSLGRG